MRCKEPDFSQLCEKIEENKQKFRAFYELLTMRNAQFNLTSIIEEEEVFHKHFLDSLAGESLFPKNAKCAEVGSGAGFPSIPLSIVRKDLSFTLIESTGKKCEFLREAAKMLELSNLTVVCGRAEDAGRWAHREKYDVVFARAVARMNTLAEYCMPLVKVGGFFLAYKGDAKGELEEAENALKTLGAGEISSCSYELPKGYGARMLILTEKAHATPFAYPRGRGLERRKPL